MFQYVRYLIGKIYVRIFYVRLAKLVSPPLCLAHEVMVTLQGMEYLSYNALRPPSLCKPSAKILFLIRKSHQNFAREG